MVNEEYVKISQNFNYKNKPLKIGYFGAFTHSVREPKNYINSIANIYNDHIDHEWYINKESKKLFSSVKNISNHQFFDIVPRKDAIEIMIKKIHILLSIGNLNKYQMPSKVIEYLSLGKPVLHFAEIEDDPLYNFEELFDNLKIINNKTTKNELEVYFDNIKEKGPTINLDNLINKFSASKLIDDLI